jgi:hypothetical protein
VARAGSLQCGANEACEDLSERPWEHHHNSGFHFLWLGAEVVTRNQLYLVFGMAEKPYGILSIVGVHKNLFEMNVPQNPINF